MPKRTERSKVIDEIIRFASLSTLTVAMIIAPNSIQLFGKDFRKYFEKMNKLEREKEINHLVAYLRAQKLISEDYEHGIKITKKAEIRLAKLSFDNLSLRNPGIWDGKWRIIFFDIPEKHKTARDAFASKVRRIGFKVLQRSVFIYPYECRDEVSYLAKHYDIEKYVSYIEANYIDNQEVLIRKFSSIIKR